MPALYENRTDAASGMGVHNMRKLIAAAVLAAVMFGSIGTGVAFADHPAASSGGIDRARAEIGWEEDVNGVPGGALGYTGPGWENGIANGGNQSGTNIVAHNALCAEH